MASAQELVVYIPGKNAEDVELSRAALQDWDELWGETEFGPRCGEVVDILQKVHKALGSTATWSEAHYRDYESGD